MTKKTYYVQGMDCASCAIIIEKKLNKTAGVKNAVVNFATEKATIEADPTVSYDKLQSIVSSEGNFKLVPENETETNSADSAQANIKILKMKNLQRLKTKMIVGIIFSLLIMILSMHKLIPGLKNLPDSFVYPFLLILTTPLQIWLGAQFYQGAWAGLKNIKANMDTLIAVGTSAAFIYSVVATLFPQFFISAGQNVVVYYDTAIVILTLIILGKYLEAKAKGKASDAISRLLKLQAKTARIIIDGQEKEIPLAEVKKGDLILVKPGERIPVDGIITEGDSSIDESMITGESIPVDKTIGDKVIGSTINKAGAFTFKAEKVGQETALAQIIDMVENAQATKAPIQRLADIISGYFVSIVILIAVFSFIIWLIFGPSFAFALIVAVTVLIIACPCSLGLATPTAIMVGTGKGAQEGILIKDAESLEKIQDINILVFDKTGTLTKGQPQVVSYSDEQTLQLAYSLEKKSEHPLGRAIVIKGEENKIAAQTVSNFTAKIGRGVQGTIDNNNYFLGNLELLAEHGIKLNPEINNKILNQEKNGHTVLVLAGEKKYLGYIAIADTLKDESRQAIGRLKALNIEPILMTGDNVTTAKVVADELEIKNWYAKVKPEDKLIKIKELQKQGNKVGMVGDGINDAPALTQANIGIAMGTGTDVAIESADIVLLNGDITKVVKSIVLSKKTMLTIKSNLFWAFIYNIIGIPVAAGTLYPWFGILLSPMIAAGAMAFSSIFVVLNSLRLRNIKL